MPQPLSIQARGLSKSFGRKEVVAISELEFEPSRIYVLLGPNGSGKTTLMKILAGLIKANKGEVRIFEKEIRPEDTEFRQRIGFLFDHSAHWDALSGWDNAWFFARSLRLSEENAKNRLGMLFGAMDLEFVRHDAVQTYSYGMRRKLSIIEALVHRPGLLFLDEPAIGLDLSSRVKLYEILRTAANEGATVVVSTNDMNEARSLAHEVVLMEKGRILIKGTPENLIQSLDQNTMIQVEVKGPYQVANLSRLEGVESVIFSEKEGLFIIQILVRSAMEEEVLGKIIQTIGAAGPIIRSVSIRRPELGDVFMRHVRRDEPEA